MVTIIGNNKVKSLRVAYFLRPILYIYLYKYKIATKIHAC